MACQPHSWRRVRSRVRTSTSAAWYEQTTANTHLPVRPDVVCAYICLSMCPSTQFKQLMQQNWRKTGQEHWGITPTVQSMMGAVVMMSPRIPAILRESTNQQAFSYHMTGKAKGRQSSNSQWGDEIVKCCIHHHVAYWLFYSTLRY